MVLVPLRIGTCTVWQVPHSSGLVIVWLCAGSMPIACFIGIFFGSLNGP